MKKITRREFIDAMTSMPHYFIYCGEYDECGHLSIDGLIPGAFDMPRTVVSVRPTYLEFSGGSRLRIVGCGFERLDETIKVTTKDGKVLVYVLKNEEV